MVDFKFKLKQEINMKPFDSVVKGIVIGRIFKDFYCGQENIYVLHYNNDRYEQTEDELITIN